jgi:hypothetical protein
MNTPMHVRRTTALLVLAIAVAVAIGALAAPVASARVARNAVPTAGMPWPKRSTLGVYSTLGPRYVKSVDLAIAQLNASGARITLKRVTRAAGAKVVIKRKDRQLPAGLSTQGRRPSGPSLVTLRLRSFDGDLERNPYAAAMLVAHELGHVLGLNHPDQNPRLCTVMNPAFFFVCPKGDKSAIDEVSPELFTCRLVQQNDKAALVKLYGGRATKAGPLACSTLTGKPWSKPRTGAMAGLTATLASGPGQVAVLGWTPRPGVLLQITRIPRDCSYSTWNDDWWADLMTDEPGDSDDDRIDAGTGTFTDTKTTIRSIDGSDELNGPVTLCYEFDGFDPATFQRFAGHVQLDGYVASSTTQG